MLPKKILNLANQSVRVDDHWHSHLSRLCGVNGDCHSEPLLTGDSVVRSVADKTLLQRRYQALSVDMESFGVAAAATRAGMPVAVLRVVLDELDSAIPISAVAAANPDGTVRWGKLIKCLIHRPADLYGLVRLSQAVEEAKRVLNASASRLIEHSESIVSHSPSS